MAGVRPLAIMQASAIASTAILFAIVKDDVTAAFFVEGRHSIDSLDMNHASSVYIH